jgi:1A family penicillin-binding protein
MSSNFSNFDNRIKSSVSAISRALFSVDNKVKIKKNPRIKKRVWHVFRLIRFLFKKCVFAPIKFVIKLPFLIIKSVTKKIFKGVKKIPHIFNFQKITQVAFLFLFSLILSATVIIYLFFRSLPSIDNLTNRKFPMTTKILDRRGRLLYKIYKNQNRSLVKLDDLPKYVKDSTIAIEDREFYHHFGISLRGIMRALAENKKTGTASQGGSTITQQLVKNALLTPERTIDRKIKEAVLAIMVERKFTKDKILEMYLNEVGYGGSAYGIEEAAQMYFGIPAKKLSLSQAAFLAGLPVSPTDYSPFGVNPEASKVRQLEVLKAMANQGYISQKQANDAAKVKLHFRKQSIEIKAAHFVFYVKQELEKKYGTEFITQGGLTIQTTLDLDIQEMAQKEVKTGVEAQKYLLVGNGAAVVEDPKNGEILAMVGSIDYFDMEHDGNVNVTTAERQPGSSIKPVTYSLALSSGLYTPSTMIQDAPVTYHTEGSPAYSPVNYDSKFHGNVSFRQALACSYNVPAVKILASLGVWRMIDWAEKLGISTWTDRSRFGYSLTLGGGEVKPIDMAKVFSVFANGGQKVEQKYVLKITSPTGRVIENNTGDVRSEQVMSPIVAFQISDILADNAARTPAFGPVSALVIPGKTVSVKTGTTDSKKDNWTIGYTKDYTIVVWIGNNNNVPMSMYLESGNTGAAAIWHPIMENLLKKEKNKQLVAPGELVEVEICVQTGTLPCPGCTIKKEYFIRGTEPREKCVKYEPPTPTPEPTKKP